MFLSGMKAVCDGLIKFSAIPVTLFTTTFVKKLKLTFNRHIGQNWHMFVTSFCFGSSVMIPKLRLK
jgi:hypothetical protein